MMETNRYSNGDNNNDANRHSEEDKLMESLAWQLARGHMLTQSMENDKSGIVSGIRSARQEWQPDDSWLDGDGSTESIPPGYFEMYDHAQSALMAQHYTKYYQLIGECYFPVLNAFIDKCHRHTTTHRPAHHTPKPPFKPTNRPISKPTTKEPFATTAHPGRCKNSIFNYSTF